MGRIKNDNLYIIDSPASKFDKVIGSDAENAGRTKNYLLGELFALFNTLGGGGVFSYTFTSDLADLDIIEGLVATNDSETDPDGVNLFRFSRTDLFGNDLRTLIENYNNNSDGVVLKVTSEADPNLMCAYTITGINVDTNWVEVSVLRHKNLNTLTFEVAKNFNLTFDLVNIGGGGGGGGVTNTSQLVNDGEDGINPFIIADDLLGLPQVGDNVSIFINDAGYVTIDHTHTLEDITDFPDTIDAYITDVPTQALLENTSNWDSDGTYIGGAITGTFQGQMHVDANYLYEATSDNQWVRLIREELPQRINAYIADPTAIGLLEDRANWNIDGVYGGVPITGTFQGQKHYDTAFFFEAVLDNIWIRYPRA